MWIKRASRGRLPWPVSWIDVDGVEGLAMGMEIGAGCEGAAGWDGGEADGWPFV